MSAIAGGVRKRKTWKSANGNITIIRDDLTRALPRLADQSVDLVLTDPPYGHNNNNGDLIHKWEAALGRGNHGRSRPIANDSAESAATIFECIISQSARLCRHGGCCCCCCGGGGPDPQFARWSLLLDQYLQFKQMVIWDKGKLGMGWHYRRSYETVLVAQVGTGRCNWYDDTRRVENIIRPGDYGIKKIIPRSDQHPTEKPVELFAHFIRLHSKPGDVVLDPCAGSGACLEAAARLGRKAIGIEIDQHWYHRAVDRIKALTKKRAGVRHAG